MSYSAENFRRKILLFLRKFLVSKSFMDEKGGIRFFRRKFLVSQCRKISWASLQCFRKFGVSKINSTTDFYFLCTTFRSKFFVSENWKISLRNTSVYQKISGSEKFYASERGRGYQDFPSKIFCLTVPKNFAGEPFSVSLISGTEKVWIRGGGSIKISCRKFFVSQCRKFP